MFTTHIETTRSVARAPARARCTSMSGCELGPLHDVRHFYYTEGAYDMTSEDGVNFKGKNHGKQKTSTRGDTDLSAMQANRVPPGAWYALQCLLLNANVHVVFVSKCKVPMAIKTLQQLHGFLADKGIDEVSRVRTRRVWWENVVTDSNPLPPRRVLECDIVRCMWFDSGFTGSFVSDLT